MKLHTSIAVCGALLQAAYAQRCSLRPTYAPPVVADGWEAQLVFDDLDSPRSVLFDSEGGLLVVEQRSGVKHLRIGGNSSCVNIESETSLIDDDAVSYPSIIGGSALIYA